METKMKWKVPTYHANWREDASGDLPDFDEPHAPVMVCFEDGLRVILGTHDLEDVRAANVLIERQPNGWAIFLDPVGGGDASGIVYFLDDGRSFVVPDGLSSESIEVLDCTATVPLIDRPDLNCGAPSSLCKATVEVRNSPAVVDAIRAAHQALAGDSNDDEHDALEALVDALEKFRLVEYRTYDSDWLIQDFVGWAGLGEGERPDEEQIQDYVREGRPADSSPIEVRIVLFDWADAKPPVTVGPPIIVARRSRE